MKKVKVGEEEVEFLEESELDSLFENLLQAAGRRGVGEKLINKAKKKIIKQTKKAEKAINKGKAKSEELRRLRESTKRLEDIVKDPSSYTREVIEELLKSL
ncbi:hypothetical protein H5U35_07480 [Candidatus Aerophobetes bacterium]|nr:hypothetical protein [Candidatus Aerophobetes bacterium]